MSRKDFELIARTIAGMVVTPEVRKHTAEMFAAALGGTNSRFDRARFIAACGVEA